MISHKYCRRAGLELAFFGLCLSLGAVVAGCATQRTPLYVDITQLAPYAHAAKPPDCPMPVLAALPLASYQQIAIVEAWADVKDQQDDVLPALRRKACETGADALVILNSKRQDMKNLLYQATPNETFDESTKKNVYSGQGEYIAEMEHTRRIGEAGHSGFYVDAIAIDYGTSENKQSSGGTLPRVRIPPSALQ
jgi:hypothetical protein